MLCEEGQGGAVLGFMAVWWCQVEREQSEVYRLVVVLVLGLLRFGQMYMVAISGWLAYG